MKKNPLVSIVVPSYNQAQYIGETLQSLVSQNYPSLEVIVQDGGSQDGSVNIALDFSRRYPEIFKVFVENDDGQADAINRGMKRASGQIMAFLNSDDTYLPGVIDRVVKEVDPKKRRFVVVGRSIFTGEGSQYVGVEHPSEYKSHFDFLAIWRRGFNSIPQPSVFWHRNVWERCGPLDATEQHALDYDLFLRFSEKYRFHCVDDLWSTYRMHNTSKSSQRSEAEVLELSIRVSRKHWGSWWSILRWRCELSYWLYICRFHEHSCHHARRAESSFRKGDKIPALVEAFKTFCWSPRVACHRLMGGWMIGKKVRMLERLLVRHEAFSEQYQDGWIGPLFRKMVTVPPQASKLSVSATHHPQPTHLKIHVDLYINGFIVDSSSVKSDGQFELFADMRVLSGKTVCLEIKSSSCFVPHNLNGSGDRRVLSLVLHNISFV
jgi:glycosyltransferase involved in cell wall biosynthesis